MNNLPKVVTQQRRGLASNPRLLDRKSDALPLSHRATQGRLDYTVEYGLGKFLLVFHCYHVSSCLVPFEIFNMPFKSGLGL